MTKRSQNKKYKLIFILQSNFEHISPYLIQYFRMLVPFNYRRSDLSSNGFVKKLLARTKIIISLFLVQRNIYHNCKMLKKLQYKTASFVQR